MGAPRSRSAARGVRAAALNSPSPPLCASRPPLHPPPRSAQVPKDKPILLADGDELGLGDVRLRVSLRRAAAEDGDEENAGPPP